MIESNTIGPGVSVYEAATGKVLFKGSMNRDVGRVVAGDIYPENPGAEMWWTGDLSNVASNQPHITDFSPERI